MPPLERAVVLGASGFIGRNLLAHLRAGGIPASGVSSAECDLLDPRAVADLLGGLGPGATVVFCAAIGRLTEDSWEALGKNLAMVRNFLGALPEAGVRSVVYLSSVDVYGLPASSLPITERTVPRPTTYYGVSKLAGEALLGFGVRPPCPVTVLRLPGIYGPDDGGRSILGSLCRRIARDEPIRLTASGATRRDFVAVGDLCRLVERLVAEPARETLNAASGASLPMGEVVALLGRTLGKRPVVDLSREAGPRDHDLVFDPSLVREVCPGVRLRSLPEAVEGGLPLPAELRGGGLR